MRRALEASLAGERIHGNMLTKIIFTIHGGLATVNLEIIIYGYLMPNPSVMQVCLGIIAGVGSHPAFPTQTSTPNKSAASGAKVKIV